MFGNRPFREHCCFPSPRGDTRCPQVAPLAVFSARNPLRHPHRRGRRAGGAGGRRFATSRWGTLQRRLRGPAAGPVGAASVPALDPQLPARDRSEIGAQLTDVTCGAAETGDFFTSQYYGVAPQLDAVKADTQLVTMTIGGNDSGVFINTIVACGTAGLSTLGQGSPCKDRYGSSFEDTIRTTTYPSLVNALRAVRAKAPRRRSPSWATRGSCRRPAAASTRCRSRGRRPLCARHPGTLNDAVRRRRRDPCDLRGPQHGLRTATTPASRSASAGSSPCCRARTR